MLGPMVDDSGADGTNRAPRDASEWVVRFASLVPPRAVVLDVACGSGRHTVLFLDRGHRAVAVDRDVTGLVDLLGHANLHAMERDLETGEPLPFAPGSFGAVVVTNYLYRPILGDL